MANYKKNKEKSDLLLKVYVTKNTKVSIEGTTFTYDEILDAFEYYKGLNGNIPPIVKRYERMKQIIKSIKERLASLRELRTAKQTYFTFAPGISNELKQAEKSLKLALTKAKSDMSMIKKDYEQSIFFIPNIEKNDKKAI